MVCSLISIYFDNPQLDIQQNQTVQHFRLMIHRYAQIDFLEKDLRIVSALRFVYDFSRKMFFMLYSIN